MKRNATVFFGCLLCCLVLFPGERCLAKKVKGVNFSETLTIKGTSCKLVGVGIRKKLVINVYLGGLYMAQPSTAADEVISSDQTKRMMLHFLYKEVTAEQLIEAWNEGFEKNAGQSVSALKEKIALFNSFFTESAKKGEMIIITYLPGEGTQVVINGNLKGTIEGTDFMKALFSIWFGQFPPSKGLKKGMLGG
ncbi:hypothetical protein ES708_02152 [subsurface metagenome]